MTGWRLGAAIGPPRGRSTVIATLNVNDESCANHFVQYGALEALTGDQSGPRHIVEVLRRAPRRRALPSCARRPGCAAAAPDTTFYLFANVTEAMARHGPERRRGLPPRRAQQDRRVALLAGALRPPPARRGRALRAPRLLGHRRGRRSSRGSSASRRTCRASGRRGRGDGRGQRSKGAEATGTAELKRTALYERHVAAGGRMVDFAGWEMPIQYPGGIVSEHLATRKHAGLFDVSHMGRFSSAAPTRCPSCSTSSPTTPPRSKSARRSTRSSPTRPAAPIDDAYLYRFAEDEYLLVVNAANRLEGLGALCARGARGTPISSFATPPGRSPWSPCRDRRRATSSPPRCSRAGCPSRCATSSRCSTAAGASVRVGRTGYTGEPLCFELFVAAEARRRALGRARGRRALRRPASARATPCASKPACRSTATSWAQTPTAARSPIYAIALAKLAVSLSPLKGDFIGRAALRAPARRLRAHRCARLLAHGPTCRVWCSRSPSPAAASPGPHAPVLVGQRQRRLRDERHVGAVLDRRRRGARVAPDRRARAALDRAGLPRLRRRRRRRGRRSTSAARRCRASSCPIHLRSDAPPFARPIVYDHELPAVELPQGRRARQGAAAARRDARQHTPGARRAVHQPHPFGDDHLAAGAPGLGHGPGLPLRRAPPGRGLLRRRRLLLPGHGLHRRSRAPPRSGACRLPRLRRDRDPRDQRPDGQHGRLQRPGRLRSTAPTPKRSRGASAW